MGVFGLIVRRSRAGLGLLLTILGLAAATTGIIAGTLGYSQAAATTAARQALTDTVPTEAGLRVQTRLGPDPGVQDGTARQLIGRAFAPVPVQVQRTLVSEARPVSGQSDRLVAMASQQLLSDDPGFEALVEVVEGSWPSGSHAGPVPGALPATVAAQWKVGLGDTLEVGDTQVSVVGLWRPVDPQAPFWFGDPLVATGKDEQEAGPLIVSVDDIDRFGDTPFVRWTVQPDAERIQPQDMPRLAAAASTLGRTIKASPVAVRGLAVEGDLAPTSATAGRNLATARALSVIPVVLLLLVSIIAVVQIARLQSTAREGEVELLIARGASRRQVLAWSITESLAVAVLATIVGIGIALAVVHFTPAGDQQGGTVVRVGLLSGLAVLAALVLVTMLQLRVRHTLADRSGRTRQVAALATLIFTLGAAGLAYWQLHQYGSPLVTDPDGSLSTDLIAGAAPALILAAGAVLTMALLGPASRAMEALTRPSRRLLTHLSASQVSRRLVIYAVPVALTVLATGATTVAGLYAATSAQLRNSLADLDQGADIRAELAALPVTGDTLQAPPDVSGLPGVTASAPVWRTATRLGTTPFTITVLPIHRLSQVALLPNGLLDPTDLANKLAPELPTEQGPALPDNGTTLTMDLDLTVTIPTDMKTQLQHDYDTTEKDVSFLFQPGEPEPSAEDIALAVAQYREDLTYGFGGKHDAGVGVVVADPDGLGRQVLSSTPVPFAMKVEFVDGQLRVTPGEAKTKVRLTIPPGHERTVSGLQLDLPQFFRDYELTLTIAGLRTEQGDNLLQDPAVRSWTGPQNPPDQADGPGSTQSKITVSDAGTLTTFARSGSDIKLPADPGDKHHILVIESPTTQTGLKAASVAVTSSLAASNGLSIGSTLTMTINGRGIGGQVAAIVPALPGSLNPDGAMVDSAVLAALFSQQSASLDSPDELWVASNDPEATRAALSGLPGVSSVTAREAVTVTDAAAAVRLVFWVASAGAVLLAVTGIGAVATNLLRSRRPEVAVLRALGMTPAGQARSRTLELVGVIAISALAGLGAGWLVGVLVIPELAQSTTLTGEVQLSAPLRLELPPWVGLLGLLMGAIALLLLTGGWRVRAQARDNNYREEIR